MGMNNQAVLKVGLVVVGLCIAGYILGPPLYWQFVEGLAAVSHSSSSSSSYACPPCQCDCSSQPILSIPEGTQKKGSHLYLQKHLCCFLDLFILLVDLFFLDGYLTVGFVVASMFGNVDAC